MSNATDNLSMSNFFSSMIGNLLSQMLKREVRNPTLTRLFWVLFTIYSKGYTYKNTYTSGELHHFISQLVLQNFNSSQGMIFEYSRGSSEPSEVSIKKEAACIKDFYTFENVNDKKSDFIEKRVFAKPLEVTSSKIFKKIKEKPNYTPTHLAKSVLSSFVAHQLTRTPLFRQEIYFLLSYLISEGVCRIDDFSKENF